MASEPPGIELTGIYGTITRNKIKNRLKRKGDFFIILSILIIIDKTTKLSKSIGKNHAESFLI